MVSIKVSVKEDGSLVQLVTEPLVVMQVAVTVVEERVGKERVVEGRVGKKKSSHSFANPFPFYLFELVKTHLSSSPFPLLTLSEEILVLCQDDHPDPLPPSSPHPLVYVAHSHPE